MATGTHHLLLYDYVEDMADRRGPYREAHLERIRTLKDEGRIVMAGALGSPPHGAAIVFHDRDPDEIDRFVHDDPYYTAGLVVEWRIEPWTLV